MELIFQILSFLQMIYIIILNKQLVEINQKNYIEEAFSCFLLIRELDFTYLLRSKVCSSLSSICKRSSAVFIPTALLIDFSPKRILIRSIA